MQALRQEGTESADALICSVSEATAVCAPTRIYEQPLSIPMYNATGQPAFPISRALLGQTGVLAVKDLRGVPVIAGYTPVGDFGLGLVAKTDVSTLYAPLREQLHLLALLVVGLVAAGTWALRSRVKPLLKTVVKEQQRVRTILDTSSDAFIAIDTEGRISDWNKEATRLFGWQESQALGRPLVELIIPPPHRAAHTANFAEFIRSGVGPVVNRRTEITGWHRDGYEIPVELSISSVETPAGHVANAFVRDIRERKAAQTRLEVSEGRLRAITDNLPVMISYIDRHERLQFLNRTFEQWTGIAVSGALGKPLLDVLGDDLYSQRAAHLQRALGGERIEFEVESQALGVQRYLQTVYVPDMETVDQAAGVYTLTTDVTALRLAERRMADLALSDSLTGLANRRRFDESLPEALARARRNRTGLALMFLDIDHFKGINDTFGHDAGDRVLVAFSGRLLASVRETDLVARFAGDEFVVLLEGLRAVEECEAVAQKFVLEARQVTHVDGEDLSVTTSIGIAYLSATGKSEPQRLLKLADQALYETKAKGRNGFTCRQDASAAKAAPSPHGWATLR